MEDAAMKINPADLNRHDSHELFMSIVVPRPIAFISTIGEDGVYNVAPFSCFTPASIKPAHVCFGIGSRRDGRKKDTLKNIEFSGDFVVNVVTESLAEAMHQASADYPSEVDEFEETGLTPVKGDQVRSPMIAESPVHMECKLSRIVEFGQVPALSHLVIGHVVLVHVQDELWAGDQADIRKLKPVGRLGGQLYMRITSIFEMERPHLN